MLLTRAGGGAVGVGSAAAAGMGVAGTGTVLNPRRRRYRELGRIRSERWMMLQLLSLKMRMGLLRMF